MKRPSVCLVSFFLVFTHSGVMCDPDNSTKIEKNKLDLNKECNVDEDCYTENCRRSFYIFKKYCKEPISMTSPITVLHQIVIPDVNNGKCHYYGPNNNTANNGTDKSEELSEFLVSGVNLPLNSKVELTYNNKTVLVTIKNRMPSNNNTRSVELSHEVAQELQIVNRGEYDCKIHLPVYKNCIVLRGIVMISPFIGIILGVVMFNQYFNF